MRGQIGEGSHAFVARCSRCPATVEVRADAEKGRDGLGAQLRDAGWTANRSGVLHRDLGELVDWLCPNCTNKPTVYFDIRENVFWSIRRAVGRLNDARFSADRLGDLDVVIEFSGSKDPNNRAIRVHFVGDAERVHVYPGANFARARPELETHAGIESDGTFTIGNERLDVHQFADRIVDAFAGRMLSNSSR